MLGQQLSHFIEGKYARALSAHLLRLSVNLEFKLLDLEFVALPDATDTLQGAKNICRMVLISGLDSGGAD